MNSYNNTIFSCLETRSKILENRIKNKYVRGSIGVVWVIDKMKENILIVWACDTRREVMEAVKVVMRINVKRRRGKEDQKLDGWIQ